MFGEQKRDISDPKHAFSIEKHNVAGPFRSRQEEEGPWPRCFSRWPQYCLLRERRGTQASDRMVTTLKVKSSNRVWNGIFQQKIPYYSLKVIRDTQQLCYKSHYAHLIIVMLRFTLIRTYMMLCACCGATWPTSRKTFIRTIFRNSTYYMQRLVLLLPVEIK